MISNWIPLIDFLPDLTQTCRLGEIHISLFLAGATSRISLKVQSHAAAEERFRGGGGGVEGGGPFTGGLGKKGGGGKKRGRGKGREEGGGYSDERAIHREISDKGSEGEKEMQGEVEAEMCARVSALARASGVCVCVCGVWEKSIQPPTSGIPERGIIEWKEWQWEKW